MFVELHILQNFAPSCLNRDDTNSPKDCEFGGIRRARISSQCSKRAIRQYFREQELLPKENLSERTKRLVEELVGRLEKKGRSTEQANTRVIAALGAVGLKVGDDNKTQYLLFLGNQEIAAFESLIEKHWDALGQAASAEAKPASKQKTAKQEKAAAKDAVGKEFAKAAEAILDGGKAADLALFGRMLADRADINVDAACQVAHAISTNKVGSMEMDFFTAVDDLKPKDTDAGADMLGTVEFNSSCFYRYANISLEQLKTNLQGDEELAKKTVDAFVRAAVSAIPTGKQNSMAAHNPPSLVFAVVRERGLWSLANAYEQSIRPAGGGSLVVNSMVAMDAYWAKLATMYGTGGLVAGALCKTEDIELKSLGGFDVPSVEALVKKVMGAVKFAGESK